MKILFLAPYPKGQAGSQRFRFEQYFDVLESEGHEWEMYSFIDDTTWRIIYKQGHYFAKTLGLIKGYLKRSLLLFRLGSFDVVFIHREAAPFGPPMFEWFITRVFKKYTVYDFDDAIWLPNTSESNRFFRLFKRFGNPADICKWSTVVSAGNDFLAEYARKYNDNVVVNPTTIDTDAHHNKLARPESGKFTIGWTGSHSTVQYLNILIPVFQKLEERFDFELKVICDVPPKFTLKSLRYVQWNKESEIEDLLSINVGVMPLPDDLWAKGKCGFKALQYLSLGIPAVVSDVGVNRSIVDHDVNGCICRTEDEWYKAICKMMSDTQYMESLRIKAREKVVQSFSIRSNKANFLSLFNR